MCIIFDILVLCVVDRILMCHKLIEGNSVIKERMNWVVDKITNKDFIDMVMLLIRMANDQDMTDFDSIQEFLEHAYICFTGQQVIEILLMTDMKLSDSDLKNHILCVIEGHSIDLQSYTKICHNDFIKQLSTLEGVFLCEMNGTIESHAFTLYITQDTITVLNSYGGHIGFYVTQRDKQEWIRSFISLFGEQENSPKVVFPNAHEVYAYIWGFPVEFIINAIGKQEYTFQSCIHSIVQLY